ncbi:hypothetical protein ACOSQ4_021644 [Xanthoceras sorbifolium]
MQDRNPWFQNLYRGEIKREKIAGDKGHRPVTRDGANLKRKERRREKENRREKDAAVRSTSGREPKPATARSFYCCGFIQFLG